MCNITCKRNLWNFRKWLFFRIFEEKEVAKKVHMRRKLFTYWCYLLLANLAVWNKYYVSRICVISAIVARDDDEVIQNKPLDYSIRYKEISREMREMLVENERVKNWWKFSLTFSQAHIKKQNCIKKSNENVQWYHRWEEVVWYCILYIALFACGGAWKVQAKSKVDPVQWAIPIFWPVSLNVKFELSYLIILLFLCSEHDDFRLFTSPSTASTPTAMCVWNLYNL